jgi:hypothetical protein
VTRRLAAFVLPVLLAGMAAFLAARLIDEARLLGQAAAVETGPLDGDRLAIALESDAILPDPAPLDTRRIAVVLERPLFSPTRRPPARVEAELVPQPVATTNVPDLRLHGIVVVGDVRMALMGENATAAVLQVRAGDHVGNWRVLDIGADAVVMQSGKETHRIRLDYHNRAQ